LLHMQDGSSLFPTGFSFCTYFPTHFNNYFWDVFYNMNHRTKDQHRQRNSTTWLPNFLIVDLVLTNLSKSDKIYTAMAS
jgi:hypothetical protein